MDDDYEAEFPEPEVRHRFLKGAVAVGFFLIVWGVGRWLEL
jgi:hypothetical protein